MRISAVPKSYGQWIESEAKKYNLDPLLIRGLIRQESAYSLRAVSTSNAMGLMQMIPPTAEEIARKLKMKVHIPDDMYRPEINVPMGTFYVSDMLNQFSQNVPMALGAYNAGPVRLKSWLELRPEVAALKEKHSSDVLDELWFDELPWTETSFYIKAILRNVLIYQLIDKGPVTLKPVFWSDLAGPAKTAKTSQTPGSIVVK
jgi:soluble lytic murein transglycosylase